MYRWPTTAPNVLKEMPVLVEAVPKDAASERSAALLVRTCIETVCPPEFVHERLPQFATALPASKTPEVKEPDGW
ncbi:TPA: hypothetical protein DCS99_01930 [Candidatus Wolfebacteria bacterium]|nr:hypothetical protein [Candidatus Wolfebacteria bacterium]